MITYQQEESLDERIKVRSRSISHVISGSSSLGLRSWRRAAGHGQGAKRGEPGKPRTAGRSIYVQSTTTTTSLSLSRYNQEKRCALFVENKGKLGSPLQYLVPPRFRHARIPSVKK